MKKASVLVVEDEPLIADDIAETLEANGYEVVGIVDEASDALEVCKTYHPDVALLDIQIEGPVDGIGLAAQLSMPVIFLTSFYDQKTLDRAKLVNPSGYIVKPFNERDLIVNLEIAIARGRRPAKSKPVANEKFFVKKDQEIVSVSASDIVYVEAYDNYSTLYTEKEKYMISHTLKSISEKLEPLGFLRIHRSYLINFDAVDSISENYVYLKGHQVMIGKSYRKQFMESLSLL
jgi:DNA-binding LytR/AlgR family response regulator